MKKLLFTTIMLASITNSVLPSASTDSSFDFNLDSIINTVSGWTSYGTEQTKNAISWSWNFMKKHPYITADTMIAIHAIKDAGVRNILTTETIGSMIFAHILIKVVPNMPDINLKDLKADPKKTFNDWRKKINRNDLQRIAIKTGLAVGTIAGFLGLNHYLSGDDSIVSYAKEYGAEGLLSKTVQQAGKTTVQTGKGMLKIALAGPAALSYLLKSSSAIEQAKKAAIENAKQAAEAAKKEAEEALAKQAAEQTANTTKSLVSYFMS
ncbi:MAG: hypothetical protein CL947_04045 [Epsilonproteobacteria bacterium]|nr:hypothetical protein [Campylobacterota bacterium]|tara:strand:- start:11819 stop:12616 length:798 start_codon:yes stop_codon:yes gene_type:complete